MVSKGKLVLSCHGVVWAGALALALWAGAARAALQRYDTATPHTPPSQRYKYIPLRGDDDDVFDTDHHSREPSEQSSGMHVSEFILTALRTALDVVRNMNRRRAAEAAVVKSNGTSLAIKRHSTNKQNATSVGTGRGFEEYFDDDHDHYHHHHETTTPKPMKQGRYTDPWAGYYDWIINEGSFKFWSAFQLFTAALLLYACLSAIYYAKFNPILPDYDREYDDYFLERTVGRKARSLDPTETPSGHSWIDPRTFQFILNAISKNYEKLS